jgi:Carboxypeptidase regulatory-like domain
MQIRLRFCLLLSVVLLATTAFAQFTSSVQGVVQDPTGAGVSKASVQLLNQATSATTMTTTDDAGNFRFVSLAPGNYTINVEASGFAKSATHVNLLTEQNLNVPITLKVGAISAWNTAGLLALFGFLRTASRNLIPAR